MAVNYYSYNHDQHKDEQQRVEDDDDDYIDMEVSFFKLSPPPPNSREFEFQMSSSMNVERDTSTSPADQLFYMGKLLPLHLPPRLQLLDKILQDSTSNVFNEEFYGTPLSTPFESCDVSPVDSCHISRELNTLDYLGVFANCDKKHVNMSWTKKLKAKIKSLFGKFDQGLNLRAKGEHSEKKIQIKEEKPCAQIAQVISEAQNERNESKIWARKPLFSRAFKRSSYYSTELSSSLISCSSYSSSSSSSSSNASSNSNSKFEATLIQGAIAHCKQSSQ